MRAKIFAALCCCGMAFGLQAQETEAQVAFKQAFYDATTQKILQNQRRALDMYLELCAKFPQEAAPPHEVARLLSEKSPDMALPFAQKALSLQPNEPWFMYSLIELLERLNRKAEAADLKMRVFAQNLDFEQAVEAAEIWIELNNKKKLNQWVASFIQEPQYQGEALGIELKRCRQIKQPKKYQKAIEKLQHRFPSNALVLGSLGEACELAKQWKQSEFWYRKLASEHPNDEKVHFAMAKLMEKQGLLDSTTAALRRGFNQEGVPVLLKVKVLQTLIDEGTRVERRRVQAWEMSQILERMHGNDPATFSTLGDMYLCEGRIDTAIFWFRRHIASATPNQKVYFQLIQLELLQREWKQALKTAEKMAELFPANAGAYLFFGLTLNKNGQYEIALEQLKSGEVYLSASDANKRLMFFREKAIAYAEMQQYERAKTEITRGLDLVGFDSDLALLHLYLKFIQGASEAELQKALAGYAEKAGETAAIRSARWLLQSRSGTDSGLKQELTQGLQTLGKSESLALEWLGDALLNMGDKQNARQAYLKAAEFQPLLMGHLQDKLTSLSEIP
jgi:tetratricopeptide (TPR) repeat protein